MIEYFDERSTEFLIKDGEPDMDMNHHFLACQQAYYTMLTDIKDVRLSEIYYALGIPFPDNYLIDYKLKKNDLAFAFYYDKTLGKIKIDIDVPDQPVVKDTIAELEKIKEEIEEIDLLRDNPYNNETEYSVSTKELRELFGKHISELKGENNG